MVAHPRDPGAGRSTRCAVGGRRSAAARAIHPASAMTAVRALIATRHGVAGRLNAPRPALVETTGGGEPRLVNREVVTVVREEWRVVDRWWTDEPVDRRYFEVVRESGRNVCVYRDGGRRCWFTQRA
jgi:hypothetical protein